MLEGDVPATEVVQASAVGADSPQTNGATETSATPEAEPDYKALLESMTGERDTAVQERDKHANDLKALRGTRAKRESDSITMQDIVDRLDAQDRSNAAVMRALAKGDAEELERIQGENEAGVQKRSAAKADASIRAEYSGYLAELQDGILKDDEGNEILPLDSPLLGEAMDAWVAAANRSDMAGVRSALDAASLVARREWRRQVREKSEQAVAAATTAAEAQAAADEADLDAGAGSGGGNLSDAAHIQAVADGRLTSREDLLKAQKIINA